MTDKTYKVFLTPLVSEGTYGDEIEISNFVKAANLSSIKKNTDSEDYNIGDYRLGSISLTTTNYCGEFNDNDPRSFFVYKSERSKIRVVYFDSLTDSSGSFKGLVSDEGTSFSAEDDTAKLKILANDSIIDTVQVQGGTLDNGDLFSDAIKALLNVPAITAVLTFDSDEIEVALDLTIDDVSTLSNISTWQAVRQILIASNSVLFIDDETIKVKTRDENTQNVSYFYGPGDTLDRENIIKITDYNNGAHRIFNSIKINDTIYSDETSVEWFGLSQKNFTMDFITDSDKELLIAKQLVNQFRYPRFEFKLTCTTQIANQIDFFDTIGVSHPIKARPYRATDVPLWDSAKYDTTEDVYPIDFGGVNIPGNLAFQIIQRIENPKEFQTTLKLRGRGKTFDDGLLVFWNSAYDFSLYDVSTWG